MRLEAIVEQFENNNLEYLKIRNIAEEKVHSTLSDSKVLLKYAFLSFVESMKKDPDKYCSLIYNDIYSPMSSTTTYLSQYHASCNMDGQALLYPEQDYFSDGCLNMVVEEAQKVYNNLAKETLLIMLVVQPLRSHLRHLIKNNNSHPSSHAPLTSF